SGRLLLLLVLELAVVHQAAHRRRGRGGDLNQIHVGLCRQAQGVMDADDAQGLVLDTVEAHLECSDLAIQPVLALDIRRPAVKKVSDLEFLQATGTGPHQLTMNTRPARRPGMRGGTPPAQALLPMSWAILWEKLSSDITPRS